jgi:hypothetical protein
VLLLLICCSAVQQTLAECTTTETCKHCTAAEGIDDIYKCQATGKRQKFVCAGEGSVDEVEYRSCMDSGAQTTAFWAFEVGCVVVLMLAILVRQRREQHLYGRRS